jgi:hypothetical protein
MGAWNTKIEGNDEYLNVKGTFFDEVKIKQSQTQSSSMLELMNSIGLIEYENRENIPFFSKHESINHLV